MFHKATMPKVVPNKKLWLTSPSSEFSSLIQGDDLEKPIPRAIRASKKLKGKSSRRGKGSDSNVMKGSSGGYGQYVSRLFMKLYKISLSFNFMLNYAWWSKMAGWRHVSKREILLRLPTICRKSFHYYSLRIVRFRTATFFLRIKRFKLGSTNYWHRTHTTAAQSIPSNSNGKGNSSSRVKWPFYSYFRSLKWFPIPLSVGFALLAYQHYGRVIRRAKAGQRTTEEESINQDWEIVCYRKIPWNSFSRVWGWLNGLTLPEWTRRYLLGWYATAFHCDLEEAETDDLKAYRNLGEFFRRNLKDGMRPIHTHSPVVSPADGTILHLGRVNSGVIEQVKGVRYSLQSFLGPYQNTTTLPRMSAGNSSGDNSDYCSKLLRHPLENSLFYCVVYLAPGDYHRFHSPTDWQIHFRRHFTGELLSVNPSVANWIGGLFSLNERAAYIGEWKHGFFSMTAVGATNVGSIRVYDDPSLHTNSRGLQKNAQVEKIFEKPISLKKGDCFGEFNLGSTIVIIFEAPNDLKFSFEQNQRIKVGQGVIDTAQDINSKTC